MISRPGSDVVFSSRETRGHDELTSLLGGFRGVLQSDQYGAYASHERKTEGIVRVGCWAHAPAQVPRGAGRAAQGREPGPAAHRPAVRVGT